MEGYATKFPGAVLSPQKVKMFNKILTELKYTLPDHRVIQCLEIIEDSKWETDEKGTRYLTGATYSDAFMQLTWYKNALLMP